MNSARCASRKKKMQETQSPNATEVKKLSDSYSGKKEKKRERKRGPTVEDRLQLINYIHPPIPTDNTFSLVFFIGTTRVNQDKVLGNMNFRGNMT